MGERNMSETGPKRSWRPTPENGPTLRQETLSQLLARILDQLSVGAWLPAAALVFLLLLIGSLRREEGNIGEAIEAIGSMSFQSLFLLIGAVIVATMLTQAFAFESIRALEGYWRPGRLRTKLSDVLCGWHLRRRNKLRRRLEDVADSAFTLARPAMLDRGVRRVVVDIIEDRRAQRSVEYASEEDLREAEELRWEEYAPTRERRRIDDLVAALAQYPRADHLVLPTRFGNTLRAYEERVHDAGVGPLEGFVQEVFHELPGTAQTEHDQFRSRLDLYCSLVAVFVVTGMTGVVALASVSRTLAAASGALAIGLIWLSYRAAIASARGYGVILRTIAELTRAQS